MLGLCVKDGLNCTLMSSSGYHFGEQLGVSTAADLLG
jgi:hypothetical protein